MAYRFKSVEEAVEAFTKDVCFGMSEKEKLDAIDSFLSGLIAGISLSNFSDQGSFTLAHRAQQLGKQITEKKAQHIRESN